MEPKEGNLFPDIRSTKNHRNTNNLCRHPDQGGLRQAKWGDQNVVRFNSEDTGPFTKINILNNENSSTTESETTKEKDPNTFYFYKGESIFINDYLGGTIMDEYIIGILRTNPKTGEPIKIRKHLSYSSPNKISRWFNGKEYEDEAESRFTTPKPGHKNLPKAK